jgi:hypothetical protein
MMEVGERRKGEFGVEVITVLYYGGRWASVGLRALTPLLAGATIFKGTGMMGGDGG